MIACVTGATGQTGSYLCELLLEKGYTVYAMKRRSSSLNTERLDHLYNDPRYTDSFKLIYGDLSDYSSIVNFISEAKPDLLFNLAAQSHVRVSFDIPEYTMDITGTGVTRVLEAIRRNSPSTRFLTASSSEMFGSTPPPQSETTPFHPRSVYGVAKVAGYYTTIHYREAYGLHASNIVSFNHESPRRLETFVTRKITKAAARISLGLQNEVFLGNLSAKRDWSHASDVSRAMLMIITADQPNDFVVSSGEMRSVEEFADIVFSKLGKDSKKYIRFDPRLLRATEVDALCGDSTKIKKALGWEPKISFDMLVDEMIQNDLKLAQQEKILREYKR